MSGTPINYLKKHLIGVFYLVMNVFKKLKAVRGAVCCKNSRESIETEVRFLFSELLKMNRLFEKDIVSIQFTVTEDLTELNPASALRKNGFAQDIPLFCAAEPNVKGALPATVRILIHYYSRHMPVPVYVHGAEVLRPELYCPIILQKDG